MLHEPTSEPQPTPQDHESRRQQLLLALRGATDGVLQRLADELVDLPDHKVFGQIEYTLRDLGHDFVTRAHQAGIDAAKKKATKAPASSAPTAGPTPASSTTAKRPG
jgi:hypothetical protein